LAVYCCGEGCGVEPVPPGELVPPGLELLLPKLLLPLPKLVPLPPVLEEPPTPFDMPAADWPPGPELLPSVIMSASGS
jgi:hypothetical protein